MVQNRVLLALFVFTCTLLEESQAQRQAVVRFNASGIQGDITFSELRDGNVRIVANLLGLRGAHNWHIHQYPVDQSLDPDEQCQGVQIGGHYDPFGRNNDSNYETRCAADQNMCEVGDLGGKFGPLPMSGQVDVIDTTGQLTFSGRYSIVGRSVDIVDHIDSSVHLDCGTIRLVDESRGAPVTLLQATFISPIAGTIYMRQVRSENVEIFGKLYWVNDSDSTMMHNWHIHIRQPGEEYRIGDCDISAEGNVGPHYDPTGNGPTSRPGYSTDCTPDTTSGCEVGDLTGKHTAVDIPARPDPYRDGAFFFTDSFLNLTDVVNRSIVIHVPNRGGPALACAPLLLSQNFTLTTASARFLQASQSSPFEDTVIFGFGQLGSSIRSLPTNDLTILSSGLNPPSTDCARENVYSPYELYEGDGEDTPDRYDLGDWRNRYRNNLAPNSIFNVFDIPVYGANSMAGRTMRSVVGQQQICSSWVPVLTTPNVLRAKASFTGSTFGPIEGAVYFIQHDLDNGVRGNTLVWVDIYYSEMNMDTSGHNWHIHQTSPEEGMSCMDSIGGHYNPFSVSLGTFDAMDSMFSDYNEDCSQKYPLRCESGDLSGKHGQLRITSDSSSRPVYAYFDPDIQLAGEYSIVGRSVGLHNFTGPLFDCGAVIRFEFSTSALLVGINAGSLLRREFECALTEGTGVDPTDVFIVTQAVSPLQPGSNISCACFILRTTGETREQADENYGAIINSGNLAQLRCTDPDALTLNFVNQSPRVEGNTITAEIQTSRPVESMRCAITGFPYQDCSSGSVTFSNVPFRVLNNRPYILRVVATTSDGQRAVIRRAVRIEQEGFCGVHFINDGIRVLGGNNVFVEFGAVGKVGSMLCSLDRQPLSPCRSPQLFANLSPGVHRLKIVPSLEDCGRDNRYRISKRFTI